MSCIPKLLEQKNKTPDKPFFLVNGAVLEAGGNYRSYDWCVTFTDRGSRCGYVAIPVSHPFNQYISLDEDLVRELEVHGEVTYLGKPFIEEKICDDIWIGFDADHYYDGRDIECLEKYFPEMAEAFIINGKSILSKSFIGPIKTMEFMENECKKLIEQLILQEK